MGKSSKRAEVARAERPVSEVARQAIGTRSEWMLQYLPLAAKCWKEDTQYVHHLRTWSRRTQAALQLFAALLPLKRTARLRKAVRMLRRAAGEARDVDVFLKRVYKATGLEKSERKQVVAFLKQRRKRAQRPIETALEWAEENELAQQFAHLLERTKWREVSEEETLAQSAPTLLEPLVVRFFHFSQQLTDEPETLHRLRIEGKKVRYAMELVEGGFAIGFRDELLPTFEKVQAKLGKINDHAAAIQQIKTWQAETEGHKFPRYLHRLADEEQRQFRLRVAQFRVWWTDTRIHNLRQQFDHYLGGPAVATVG